MVARIVGSLVAGDTKIDNIMFTVEIVPPQGGRMGQWGASCNVSGIPGHQVAAMAGMPGNCAISLQDGDASKVTIKEFGFSSGEVLLHGAGAPSPLLTAKVSSASDR